MLTPEQVKEIWPLCVTDGIIGAIQHPDDGYIQPADLTQALARGARNRGAEIMRYTTVLAIERVPGGEWLVRTDKGDIACEHVVSCTGNFARRTGAMVGLDVPVIPVEHQYIVTEPHPAIVERHRQGLPEMGVLREADSSWYMREEAGGLILGPYEQGAPCCYVDGPDKESEYELFQEDLERLEPHIETAIARVPAFGEVGIKKVYNGAIAYTPDGSPIVGPAPGLRNFWLNEGHSFGVTAAGGAGWQLAEWIVDGEPTVDMMGVDPRRFGPYATRGYLRAKNEEAYANVFTPHYPDEERTAARPLKTAPCYERMKALGAVFGSVYGWERPNWFAPAGYEVPASELNVDDVLLNENHAPPADDGKVKERWSFRRSNYFPFVGDEIRNVTTNVGLQDMSPFAKALVSGPGAREWLESILANRIPKTRGRIALCHLLSANGGTRAEFTVYERAPGQFYLVSAGALERHDHDILRSLLPADGSVEFQPITQAYGVLIVAGPRSRELLQRLTDTDLSTAAFPWLTGKPIIGRAVRRGRASRQFRRRTRMGTAPPDRDAERHFRPADEGRRALRHQAVRHPRDDVDGAGEILPPRRARDVHRIRCAGIRARPLRASEQGRLRRPRRARCVARARLREPLRHAGGARRDRRRRARVRACLAQRRARRAHHVRRLWLAGRKVAGARPWCGQISVGSGRNSRSPSSARCTGRP